MMSHATAANTAANRNQPASLNVRREIHGLRLLLSSSVISFGAPVDAWSICLPTAP